MSLHRLRRSPLLRRVALFNVLAFVWTFILAMPAQVMAQSALRQDQQRPGYRLLTAGEMRRITGRGSGHATAVSPEPGGTYSWEASVASTNTANGNKLTQIPLVGWTARGGLPVAFTLAHNSQSPHNSELGYKWTHSYDLYLVNAGGNLTAHWGDDLAYTFTRNVDGSYSPPTGIHDTLVKNGDNTYTLTRPDQTTYHYKTNLYCDTISDENGNSIAISYNSGNYVTTVVDPTGRTITLAYDGSNRISTVTDPLGRVWTMTYNASNNLTSIALPALSGVTYNVGIAYDGNHNIATLTSPAGRTQSFTYNAADNSLATQTDGVGNVTTWTQTSTTTTITDANSHSTVYTYSGGLLTSVKDATNLTESYLYDASNNRKQVTDKRGKIWTYTFDSSGNQLTATDPYSHTTTTTYNSHNRPLTITDPLGHVTATIVYDTHDNPTSVTDALGHATAYTYTANGLKAAATDALSHGTSFTYNANGDCTLVVDPNSNQTSATYDGLGNRLTATDGLSHTTTFTLDNWSRVTAVATPAGTTSTVYDADGLPTSVTDGNGHVTTQTFDNDARPVLTTKANGDTFTNTYDATGKKGLLSSTTDGNGHVITFSYTARNEKSSASYPDSTSESWTYLATGQTATHVDGKGWTTTLSYDDAGRLITVTYPHDHNVSYVYDNAGRKTSMTDGTGTTGYTYDNANRLTQLAQPNGTVSYAYDNANRRTGMTLTGTGSWSYAFDAANRLTSTTNPYSETTSLTYDNANRVTQQTSGNGAISVFTYDSANRTTDILHKQAGGTTLAHYQYAYDAASNVTSRTDTDGTVTTFGYDNSDQLTSEVRDNSHSTGYTISYTYDHNQNRLTKVLNGTTDAYTYDAHDKLLTAGSKSYTYDSNGNCTKVTVGTSVTTLTYDDSNRVTGITYPGGGTNSFVYNGEDLRVSKTDSAGTSAVTTDGATPASAVLKDSRAVYTPGLSEHAGSGSKFYHGDALGSTRGITDSTQATTDAVLYDAFGMTVSRTGTTATPFGFVGVQQYQTDADSGLQLLGHRYYDASVGRFISSDPAKAGTNWWAYCENAPLRATDPTGLFAWAAALLPVPGVGEVVGVVLIGGAIVVGIGWAFDHQEEIGRGIGDTIGWIGRRLGDLGRRLFPPRRPRTTPPDDTPYRDWEREYEEGVARRSQPPPGGSGTPEWREPDPGRFEPKPPPPTFPGGRGRPPIGHPDGGTHSD